MKFTWGNQPLGWIFWHPHQGLWNWTLIGIIKKCIPLSIINKTIIFIIIQIDNLLLLIRVLARRIIKTGLKSIFNIDIFLNIDGLLYFDLGTHREANELSVVTDLILPRLGNNYRAFGFEASRAFYEEVKSKYVHKKNVKMINCALCFELPKTGKVKLFIDPEGGDGNSIYRNNFAKFEEVVAVRLSDWIRRNQIDLSKHVCLLRMNIEGAEYDVIKDLVDSHLAEHIDGYYGMWDDVSKIDIHRDKEFRALLAKHDISPITFNGRDLKDPLRMMIIKYDIKTSLLSGLNKKFRSPN
jgi:FkbM family methyltransferase